MRRATALLREGGSVLCEMRFALQFPFTYMNLPICWIVQTVVVQVPSSKFTAQGFRV